MSHADRKALFVRDLAARSTGIRDRTGLVSGLPSSGYLWGIGGAEGRLGTGSRAAARGGFSGPTPAATCSQPAGSSTATLGAANARCPARSAQHSVDDDAGWR